MENLLNEKEAYEKPMLVELALCTSDIVSGASADALEEDQYQVNENDEGA